MVKKFLFFFIFFIFFKFSFSEQQIIPQILIPYSENLPKIDGVIEENEWEDASFITGFSGATGKYSGIIVPGLGTNTFVYLKHDKKNLYIGIILKDLSKRPSKNYRKRDEPVYLDNPQVELWITPPAEGNIKSYQLIVNGYNAIFDAEHIPSLGVERTSWNGNWIVRSSYKDKKWTVEISVSFESFGVKDIDKNNIWKGMIGIAWPQCSFPYTYGWYKNVQAHAQFIFSPTNTYLKIKDLSHLVYENKLKTEIEIFNGKDKEDEFFVFFGDGSSEIYKKSFKIGPKQSFNLNIDENVPKISSDKKQQLIVKITTHDTILFQNKYLYSSFEREEKQEEIKEEKWEMKTRINFAPLSLGLYLWCDILDYPKRDELKSVKFEIFSPEQKLLIEKEIEKFEYDSAESYIFLPKDLKYGKYKVHTKFISKQGKVLEEKIDTFEHKDLKKEFIFLGNNFGKNIKVAPPFEKITLKEKKDSFIVNLWGREIEFKGVLPERIRNQNEEMLPKSINLYVENSGKIIPAKISKPFKITRKSDERVDFIGEYKIEDIIFKFDGYIEFDGMIYYKMEVFVPEKRNLNFDRIFLSIPVNQKNAKYFFSTAGGWSPVFGEVSKEGIIWKSDEIADFVPYVCLTDDKIALHWFSDNDHNWILGKDYPTCEIVKEGEVVEMKINFVRKKGKIENFNAEFGLIASPIKPLPSGWRNTCLHFTPIANSKINFFYGPGHGGCPIDPHDTKKLAQAMGVYREGENPDQTLINLPKNSINWSNPDVLKNAEKILGKNGVEFIKNWERAKNNQDPYKVKRCYFFNASMYFEGYKSKAFSTFFPAEWTLVPQSWFHLTPVESYRDFFAFHMEIWFRHWFIEGFYFDEVYHGPDYNVFNGNGKIMEDGTIRPSIPLMHQREFMKRMRQLFIDHNREPFIWVHTTNYMAPYAISPADIAMFGEDKTPIPGNDIIDTIPNLLLRSFGRSQKFGFIPVWMNQTGRGSGIPWSFYNRQAVGWFWMHDVVPEVHTSVRGYHLIVLRQKWGIDKDDVIFIPYWDNSQYVKVDDEKFIVSLWKQANGKIMLQIMNLNKDENRKEVNIVLNEKNLNLNENYKIYDIESDERIIQMENNLREGEKLYNQDPQKNKDKIKELTKDLHKLYQVVEYDLKKFKIVSEKNNFKISVPPRDFKILVIE